LEKKYAIVRNLKKYLRKFKEICKKKEDEKTLIWNDTVLMLR